jgi:hypothetical protein
MKSIPSRLKPNYRQNSTKTVTILTYWERKKEPFPQSTEAYSRFYSEKQDIRPELEHYVSQGK